MQVLSAAVASAPRLLPIGEVIEHFFAETLPPESLPLLAGMVVPYKHGLSPDAQTFQWYVREGFSECARGYAADLIGRGC